MNMMPLPSGLSLFIHLGIIFVAWFLGLFGISRLYKKEVQDSKSYIAAAQRISTRVLSLLILAVIGTLMTVFLFIALQTGFREGAREPHRVFISNSREEIGKYMSSVPDMLQYRAEYEKPDPKQKGPMFATR